MVGNIQVQERTRSSRDESKIAFVERLSMDFYKGFSSKFLTQVELMRPFLWKNIEH